jgi:energy-coupling factor transport system permease protein
MSGVLTLYRDTGSGLARIDPRAKLVAAALVTAALIVSDSLGLKAAVVAVLLAAWLGARLGVKLLAITTGSLTFFFLTTLTLRAVIRGRGAADAVAIGPLRYSPSGAIDGVTMCLQILGVILALSLLVRTTRPMHLAEGMELLLRPLRRFGVPAHEAVMMFTIAMRFLPIMVREVSRMQTAQLARGGGVQRGGLGGRLRAVLPLVVPVVVVALVRARDLAEAMDSRGYRGAQGRTMIREYRLGPVDGAVVAVGLLALGVAIGLLV